MGGNQPYYRTDGERIRGRVLSVGPTGFELKKEGRVEVCVATASLELGIDIGHVDLVCQIGSPRSVAVALQRIGRSGHAVHATPKGRFFPVTRDELVECAALVRQAVLREGCIGKPLVLHADNGSPQKSSTLRVTLDRLGIEPSYSRPRVSNDNAYAEALFRTVLTHIGASDVDLTAFPLHTRVNANPPAPLPDRFRTWLEDRYGPGIDALADRLGGRAEDWRVR